MPLGIFHTYFERGSSPPPPPPPQTGGRGLKLFSACSPCCEEVIESTDIYCREFASDTYRGQIAIINGSGIFPLTYKGLNDLGYPCWRGVVTFPNGIAGSINSYKPTGDSYTITSVDLNSVNISYLGFFRYFYTPPYSLITLMSEYNMVYTSNDWEANLEYSLFGNTQIPTFGGNRNASCNLSYTFFREQGCMTYVSEPFKICNVTNFTECFMEFPNVEYEYYKIPEDGDINNPKWFYRIRYSESEDFKSTFYQSEPGGVSGSGSTPCELTFNILLYGYQYFISSNPKFYLNLFHPDDFEFWSFSQPVYTWDKDNEIFDYFQAVRLAGNTYGSRPLFDLSFSPVYAIYSCQSFGGIGLVCQASTTNFVGWTENSPEVFNFPDFDAGLNDYHSADFSPKFPVTVNHPLFCGSDIVDGASLKLKVNNYDYSSKQSFMLANGMFRAVVPYPLKRYISLAGTIGRAKKLSPILNCQISTPQGLVNCPIYLCIDRYPNSGAPNMGTYVGQPDKYSIIILGISDQYYVDFRYIKFHPDDQVYQKPMASWGNDLESGAFTPWTLPVFPPSSYCPYRLYGCIPYDIYTETSCNPELTNDNFEFLPDPWTQYIQTDINFKLNDTNILNTDPLVFQFDISTITKVTYENEVSEVYIGPEPFTGGVYKYYTHIPSDINSPIINYDHSTVTITELT